MSKTYDKHGRESGNFPNTQKELEEFEEYENKLKRMLAKLGK